MSRRKVRAPSGETVDAAAWPRAERAIHVPGDMLDRYIAVALRSAEPRRLEEAWYADLPSFPGVWAEGTSPKECLDTLAEVLREWLIVKIADNDRDIPRLDDIDLNALS